MLAAIPPWLILAAVLGGALGAAYKCLRPRGTPAVLVCAALFACALAVGHLLAVVGDLPSWQLGELRLLPGLAIGGILVWFAKPSRV